MCSCDACFPPISRQCSCVSRHDCSQSLQAVIQAFIAALLVACGISNLRVGLVLRLPDAQRVVPLRGIKRTFPVRCGLGVRRGAESSVRGCKDHGWNAEAGPGYIWYMSSTQIRRIGGVAFSALAFQLFAAASAPPCTSVGPSGASGDNPQAAMAGMPMPSDNASQHDGEDCSEQQTAPTCDAAFACAVVAIPSTIAAFATPQLPPAVPVTTAAVLASALSDPDRPPPRA